jgi:hypothetical protein
MIPSLGGFVFNFNFVFRTLLYTHPLFVQSPLTIFLFGRLGFRYPSCIIDTDRFGVYSNMMIDEFFICFSPHFVIKREQTLRFELVYDMLKGDV